MNPIRFLLPGDAEAAAALIRRAFAAITLPIVPAPSGLRVDAAEVRAALAAGGGAGWDEDGLLGCVLWRREEGGLHLGRLAVEPAARGRGIARALIAAAEAEGRRLGSVALTLDVRLPLEHNRRLFARCGFVETRQHAHPGFAHPTFVRAEKRLS